MYMVEICIYQFLIVCPLLYPPPQKNNNNNNKKLCIYFSS